MHVEEDEHVAGKINKICDDFSRGVSVVSPEKVGLPTERVIDLGGVLNSSNDGIAYGKHLMD
jgi:hypothetical protein